MKGRKVTLAQFEAKLNRIQPVPIHDIAEQYKEELVQSFNKCRADVLKQAELLKQQIEEKTRRYLNELELGLSVALKTLDIQASDIQFNQQQRLSLIQYLRNLQKASNIKVVTNFNEVQNCVREVLRSQGEEIDMPYPTFKNNDAQQLINFGKIDRKSVV
jgi:hypothetical protein